MHRLVSLDPRTVSRFSSLLHLGKENAKASVAGDPIGVQETTALLFQTACLRARIEYLRHPDTAKRAADPRGDADYGNKH